MLSLDAAILPHAEQHDTAGAVEERAHRPKRISQFAGRALELQRLSLALSYH
jgi:hypothetical protein